MTTRARVLYLVAAGVLFLVGIVPPNFLMPFLELFAPSLYVRMWQPVGYHPTESALIMIGIGVWMFAPAILAYRFMQHAADVPTPSWRRVVLQTAAAAPVCSVAFNALCVALLQSMFYLRDLGIC